MSLPPEGSRRASRRSGVMQFAGRTVSLRGRLLLMIIVPLVLISIMIGAWRFNAARTTSDILFDRTLIALNLAIAGDVASSGGDALSPAALNLMRDTSGGPLFYHVAGPDGTFMTGYAYPPRAPATVQAIENIPVLFDGTYRGEPVRVARLTELKNVEGVTGYVNVTVWQNKAARIDFARQLALRAVGIMALLIVTVAAIVWFGIKIGLKPLTDLEDAIARRSPDDLSVIRRRVPEEAADIVERLNILFLQVAQVLSSRERFISDAAHQLRNPMAGLLSLAVAARDATSDAARHSRTVELVEAARNASRLTQQLLSYERARGLNDHSTFRPVDLVELAREVSTRNAARCFEQGVELAFETRIEPGAGLVSGDAVMLTEVVQNLIDNALAHAGADNTLLEVSVTSRGAMLRLGVRDEGCGIAPDDVGVAFARFGQLRGGSGSGLGLAIVREIAQQHGGSLSLEAHPRRGAYLMIELPRLETPAA